MTISIQRQLIRTQQEKIKYWLPEGSEREHYHVGIWIEGEAAELDDIERVEYRLHPSFKKRTRSSSNRGNKFSITFWTWGMFMIDVILNRKDGSKETISYYLTYDLPADDGTNYALVDE